MSASSRESLTIQMSGGFCLSTWLPPNSSLMRIMQDSLSYQSRYAQLTAHGAGDVYQDLEDFNRETALVPDAFNILSIFSSHLDEEGGHIISNNWVASNIQVALSWDADALETHKRAVSDAGLLESLDGAQSYQLLPPLEDLQPKAMISFQYAHLGGRPTQGDVCRFPLRPHSVLKGRVNANPPYGLGGTDKGSISLRGYREPVGWSVSGIKDSKSVEADTTKAMGDAQEELLKTTSDLLGVTHFQAEESYLEKLIEPIRGSLLDAIRSSLAEEGLTTRVTEKIKEITVDPLFQKSPERLEVSAIATISNDRTLNLAWRLGTKYNTYPAQTIQSDQIRLHDDSLGDVMWTWENQRSLDLTGPLVVLSRDDRVMTEDEQREDDRQRQKKIADRLMSAAKRYTLLEQVEAEEETGRIEVDESESEFFGELAPRGEI